MPSQKIALHARYEQRALDSQAPYTNEAFKVWQTVHLSSNISLWWTSGLVWTCWEFYETGRREAQNFFAEIYGVPCSGLVALRGLFIIYRCNDTLQSQVKLYRLQIRQLEEKIKKFEQFSIDLDDGVVRIDTKDPKQVLNLMKRLWKDLPPHDQLDFIKWATEDADAQLASSLKELSLAVKVVMRPNYEIGYDEAKRTSKYERRKVVTHVITHVAKTERLNLMVDVINDLDLMQELLSMQKVQLPTVSSPLNVRQALVLMARLPELSDADYHVMKRMSGRLPSLESVKEERKKMIGTYGMKHLDAVCGIKGSIIPLHTVVLETFKTLENIVLAEIKEEETSLDVVGSFSADGVTKTSHDYVPELKQRDSKWCQMAFYVVAVFAVDANGNRRRLWTPKLPGSGENGVPIFLARCEEKHEMLVELTRGYKEVIRNFRQEVCKVAGRPAKLIDCWPMDMKLGQLLNGQDSGNTCWPIPGLELHKYFFRSPWRRHLKIDQYRDPEVMVLQAELATMKEMTMGKLRRLAAKYAEKSHVKFKMFQRAIKNFEALGDDVAVTGKCHLEKWLRGFRAGIINFSNIEAIAPRTPYLGLHADESIGRLLIKLTLALALEGQTVDQLVDAWKLCGLEDCQWPGAIQGNTARDFVAKMFDWIPAVAANPRQPQLETLIKLWALMRSGHRDFDAAEELLAQYGTMSDQFLAYLNEYFGDFRTNAAYLGVVTQFGPRVIEEREFLVEPGRIIEDPCEHLNQRYKNCQTNNRESTKNKISIEDQIMGDQLISSNVTLQDGDVDRIVLGEPQHCSLCQKERHKKKTCNRLNVRQLHYDSNPICEGESEPKFTVLAQYQV